MADFTFPTVTANGVTVLDRFYLQTLVQDARDSALDHAQLFIVDTTMEEEAGMKKVIATYAAVPTAEEVAENAGNTVATTQSIIQKQYDVKVVQEHLRYTDEQMMRDPSGVNALLSSAGVGVFNKVNSDFIAELAKTTNAVASNAISFDDFIDAQALIDYAPSTDLSQGGEGSDLSDAAGRTFALVGKKTLAAIRKAMRSDISNVEPYVRTGYVGTVANTELHYDRLMDAEDYENTVFVCTPEAVTLFLKQDIEVEVYDKFNRGYTEGDKRQNDINVRQAYAVALTDETKAAKIVISGAEG